MCLKKKKITLISNDEEQTYNADAIRDDHGHESVSRVLAVDLLAQLVRQVTAVVGGGTYSGS